MNTDSIGTEHLLRRDAEELRESSTLASDPDDWTGEEEAKEDYDEHIAAADALAALSTAAAVPPEGWPQASAADNAIGWTLDYKFLEKVEALAKMRTEYSTSMEATEQVLIAALEVLAAAPKAAPQPAVQQGRPVAWRSWDSENSRWNFTLWPDEWAGHTDAWEPLYTQPATPAAQEAALIELIERVGNVRIQRVRKGFNGPIRWEVEYGYEDTAVHGRTLRDAINAAARAQAKEGGE